MTWCEIGDSSSFLRFVRKVLIFLLKWILKITKMTNIVKLPALKRKVTPVKILKFVVFNAYFRAT